MYQIILILHIVFAIALVGLILMQQGKGAAAGSAFGAGASGTVFGSQGAGSFMLKVTGLFGLLFFVTSLMLAHMAGGVSHTTNTQDSLLDRVATISQAQEAQKKPSVSTDDAQQAIESLTHEAPASRVSR